MYAPTPVCMCRARARVCTHENARFCARPHVCARVSVCSPSPVHWSARTGEGPHLVCAQVHRACISKCWRRRHFVLTRRKRKLFGACRVREGGWSTTYSSWVCRCRNVSVPAVATGVQPSRLGGEHSERTKAPNGSSLRAHSVLLWKVASHGRRRQRPKLGRGHPGSERGGAPGFGARGLPLSTMAHRTCLFAARAAHAKRAHSRGPAAPA